MKKSQSSDKQQIKNIKKSQSANKQQIKDFVLKNMKKLLKDIVKSKDFQQSLKKNKLFENIKFKDNIKGGTLDLVLNGTEFTSALRTAINRLDNRNVSDFDNLLNSLNIDLNATPDTVLIPLFILVFMFLIVIFSLPFAFIGMIEQDRLSRSPIRSPIRNQISNIPFEQLVYIKASTLQNVKKREDDESINCPICMEPYNNQRKECLVKPCNHRFCKICLEENCKTINCLRCSKCRGTIEYVIEL